MASVGIYVRFLGCTSSNGGFPGGIQQLPKRKSKIWSISSRKLCKMKIVSLLLQVQKSQGRPPFGCKKNIVKNGVCLPSSTGESRISFTINTINQKRKLSIFQPFYLFFETKTLGSMISWYRLLNLVNELGILLDYYPLFLLRAKKVEPVAYRPPRRQYI